MTISTQIVKRSIPDLYIRGSRVMDGLNLQWTKPSKNSTSNTTQSTTQNKMMETKFKNTIKTQIPKEFIKRLNSLSITNNSSKENKSETQKPTHNPYPPQQDIIKNPHKPCLKPPQQEFTPNAHLNPFEAALKKVITQRIQKLNKSLLIAKFEGNTTAVNQIKIFLQELNQQLASLENNPKQTPTITY
jgi:hypothetical protein